ncbi:pyruvate formate lyase activating enzyme [Desulfonispora thiosulfatigenes DSM 11270]|uniref:Pyruvate formate-lyase-activating enzyme n=1 Tax=Desulfonispora thiosulfatigenes DSM 11270 TaxID=656914 RepID=A0A1W1UUY5_DESTI|nr:pyruvate formate-lyase-activating protein [Desulfonispora thiosulfatigenes]SMB84850.1 pyruvate formate lyase activating enzyme [Desulfonispora thiosulfatigenes DSM 11270]
MGKIHSIETMGLLDGPGIRYVVFFQGCKLRCSYCHNPDTWNVNGGTEISAEELVKKAIRFKPYFEKSNGGVTCSGGDPLLQPEFLLEFLKLCKKNNIHTTIDTAGFGQGNYAEILKYTDLVILDIKHVNARGYKDLTGGRIEEYKEFKEEVLKANKKLWLRHVVVPGVTSSREHLLGLRKEIKTFKNVEKIELLPYHNLGENKYTGLGIDYKLAGIKPLDKTKVKEYEKLLVS